MSTRPFVPGVAFRPETGKLYLFGLDSVVVVRPWPDPAAWRRQGAGPWLGFRPRDVDLSAPERLAAWCRVRPPGRLLRCQAAAWGLMPDGPRHRAAQFRRLQWDLYVLFSRVPGALEMAEHNPALAAALALAWRLRPEIRRPLRAARALLRSPGPCTARRVAAWLGFPDSRAAVRLLRRLPPAQVSAWHLRVLRAAIADPSCLRQLSHLPVLNGSVLWAVEQQTEPGGLRAAPGLLLELAAHEHRKGRTPTQRLSDLRGIWAEAWPERPMPPVRSLAHAARLEAAAAHELSCPERLRAWALAHLPPIPRAPTLPPPPRGLTFRPLVSVDALLEEGQRMGHCIGSRPYLSLAAKSPGVGLAVEGPGSLRHTAWVTFGAVGELEVEELRGVANAEPDPWVALAMDAWAEEQNRLTGKLRSLLGGLEIGETLAVRRPEALVPPPPDRWAPPPQGVQLALFAGACDDMPF